jgi:acyl carrier protein
MGLNSVEIVMEVENEFGISIPDADVAYDMRVGELADYISRRVREAGNLKGLSKADVLLSVRQLISEQMGMPMDEITPEKRFQADLHID